ncbi:uncharacterized protein LOC62_06G008578 [Vanrija pseudolonga]|uniref:Uncharacterized protein n=1 Tax=Vanrija pseudolonga TaxID=143232 RepID=A0AAF1BTQ2_9TREE|nr:hypothetical protein LOC62_06G008578 [Vanrija pseudolonga]
MNVDTNNLATMDLNTHTDTLAIMNTNTDDNAQSTAWATSTETDTDTDTNAPAPSAASAASTAAERKSKYISELSRRSPTQVSNMLTLSDKLKADLHALGPNANYLALGFDEMALLLAFRMVMEGTPADPNGAELQAYIDRLGGLLPFVETEDAMTKAILDLVHLSTEVLKLGMLAGVAA